MYTKHLLTAYYIQINSRNFLLNKHIYKSKRLKMKIEKVRIELLSSIFVQWCCHPNFLYMFWIFLEKICILVTNWGKHMHFPSYFHPLSIVFFPTCYFVIFLPPPPAPGGGGGVKQKNIHPWFDPLFTPLLYPTSSFEYYDLWSRYW